MVLVAARNPLNIGAAARAMSNFGILHLRVVNPYKAAFREARSAVGASALLATAEEYETVAEAVADCTVVVGTTAVRHRELQHPLRRLEYGTRLIRKQLGSSRVALLFGSEKFGLSNAALSHCHWLMRIPTCEENISMNLGQAVAVCLYELVRDSKAARPAEKVKRASSSELERITTAATRSDALQRLPKSPSRLQTSRKESVAWSAASTSRRMTRRPGSAFCGKSCGSYAQGKHRLAKKFDGCALAWNTADSVEVSQGKKGASS